ncbi:MAG TPA: amidohydrolase family protein [Streptosporangiaceae bacterium]|nr:amidohydrolase family protein [Streptosporangiaceae bacterium]
MTIDAHHHVWDLSVRDQPWLDQPQLAPIRRNFLICDLEPEAAAHGITETVVVQTVTEPEETPELLALAESSDLVAGVVGWVDLEAAGVADVLAALRELPGGDRLVSIRHPVIIESDPDWLARPSVLHGLAAVAAAGLCYDVVVMPEQLRGAVLAAAALPELTFVLDHLGNPDVEGWVGGPVGGAADSAAGGAAGQSWTRGIADFAARPNTVAKLSGFLGELAPRSAGPPFADLAAGGDPVTGGDPVAGDPASADPAAGADPASVAHLRPYYEIALAHFGPQRLMYGSDWPVSTINVGYGGVYAAARSLAANLSPSEKAAIFSGTARSTYGLRT